MTFNSIEFFIFLPIVLFLYWIIPHKYRYILLLIASYFFYAVFNIPLLLLIVFTTTVAYFSGLLMEKYGNSKKSRTSLLILTLISSLGVLFFFKYFVFTSNLFLDLINLFGAGLKHLSLKLLLPVGISFYTFQTLSYVIDVYRKKIKPERNYLYFALFVSFFPQLVAGPIERPQDLLPQLKEDKKLTGDDLVIGLRYFAVGFLKKIVIADGFATFVEKVYNSPSNATGLSVIIATILFAMQIYCDFSGYTDIAIGTARLMGVKLTKNFDRPYSSKSIKEFWRRWHITLSSWLRDYLYIPLGGSRVTFARWCVNILIVFLVSGLWHGANLTFVVWGLLHGIYQIVETLIEKLCKKKSIKSNALLDLLRQGITFSLVCIAWIFFRSNSLSDAFLLISKLFSDYSQPASYTFELMDIGYLEAIRIFISFILLIFVTNILEYKVDGDHKNFVSRKLAYMYIILAVIVGWILLISSGCESSFIYFQF